MKLTLVKIMLAVAIVFLSLFTVGRVALAKRMSVVVSATVLERIEVREENGIVQVQSNIPCIVQYSSESGDAVSVRYPGGVALNLGPVDSYTVVPD